MKRDEFRALIREEIQKFLKEDYDDRIDYLIERKWLNLFELDGQTLSLAEEIVKAMDYDQADAILTKVAEANNMEPGYVGDEMVDEDVVNEVQTKEFGKYKIVMHDDGQLTVTGPNITKVIPYDKNEVSLDRIERAYEAVQDLQPKEAVIQFVKYIRKPDSIPTKEIPKRADAELAEEKKLKEEAEKLDKKQQALTKKHTALQKKKEEMVKDVKEKVKKKEEFDKDAHNKKMKEINDEIAIIEKQMVELD